MVARGHEVTVVCASPPLSPGTHVQAGIEIVRLQLAARLYGTPILPSLHKTLSRLTVDVLHGNFPSPYVAFNVAAVAFERKIPAVLTWHNDLPAVTSAARLVIEAHDHLVLPRYLGIYKHIICTSESYQKRSRILRGAGRSVIVVPNGVDCDLFRPNNQGAKLRKNMGWQGKFVLLFVGALTKWHGYKGLDILLAALSKTSRIRPDVRLLVVGEGERREDFSQMSRSLNISKNVVFAGNVADSSLPKYYSAADALVLPSKDMSEGFGLTLLEANACGKPVLASNVGGIPSVVKNEFNGLLVPPNDAEALAAAIMRLVEKPDLTLKMGRNGRKFALSHDWKLVASQTEKVYMSAIFQSSRGYSEQKNSH